MLQQLFIRDFAVIKEASIEWQSGLTVITGETGAGKSILMAALNMVLGARADATVVPAGCTQSVISAVFTVPENTEASTWLLTHGHDAADALILKRTINRDGRSRAYVNGEPITLTQLRELAALLFDIHSQHAHMTLLEPATQLSLVDAYAGHHALLQAYQDAYRDWRQKSERLSALTEQSEQRAQQVALLTYQLEELGQLAPQEGEFEALDAEHRKLCAAEAIQIACSQSALALANDDMNIRDSLARIRQTIERHLKDDAELSPFVERLTALEEEVSELAHELEAHAEHIEHNPERLAEIEARMHTWVTLARKHQVLESALPATWQRLQSEYEAISAETADTESLAEQVNAAQQKAMQLAQQLNAQRRRAAAALAASINEKLAALGMQNARIAFDIESDPARLTPAGMDRVTLLFASHAKSPLQPLGKIASGGELSRLALAIYVTCLQYTSAQTIVFDEIDVGIGGATAEVVGRMLRQLASGRQVICITHQPQVASLGHQHLFVTKTDRADGAHSEFIYLDADGRCNELARMLGGIDMTETTRQHARELLENAQAQ